MLSPTEKAKDIVASYWAIIYGNNKDNPLETKDTIYEWMNSKIAGDFGIPLVAKQCALLAVDEIIASYEEGAGELLHWQKVKQALIVM